jgi:hypothetical protein
VTQFGHRLSYDNSIFAVGAIQQDSNSTSSELASPPCFADELTYLLPSTAVFSTVFDVMMVNLPQPSASPVAEPSPLPSAQPKQGGDGGDDDEQAIFGVKTSLYVGFGCLGGVVIIGWLLLHFHPNRKGLNSRTNSYERKNIHFIQRKQTKQIHCVR